MSKNYPMTVLLTALVLLASLVPATGGADDDTGHDLANELALLESWLAAQRAYDRLPAVSAAIVHDQELLWRGAFGYADTERKQPAAADTIYGICSISKLFTGIAVMQLRDRGKITGCLLPVTQLNFQ